MKYLLLFAFCLGVNAQTLTYEQKIVSMTILAEAANQGFDGMAAVACVIKVRSINRNLPPHKICLQNKQFSCFNNKRPKDLQYLLKTKQARFSNYLAQNINNLNLNKIKHSDHYHATWMKKKPYWAKNKKPLIIIKDHAFYKLN